MILNYRTILFSNHLQKETDTSRLPPQATLLGDLETTNGQRGAGVFA